MAVEAVEGLYGVRLDTPGSRKGKMKRIVEEVRWELDLRGYQEVKIIVSGGIDEEEIRELDRVDGFGVGTSISSATTLDFAMDLIEMEGKPCAKRGKFGGKKEVFGCPLCLRHRKVPSGVKEKVTCPACQVKMESLLQPLVKGGKIEGTLPTADEVREFVLGQLEKLEV